MTNFLRGLAQDLREYDSVFTGGKVLDVLASSVYNSKLEVLTMPTDELYDERDWLARALKGEKDAAAMLAQRLRKLRAELDEAHIRAAQDADEHSALRAALVVERDTAEARVVAAIVAWIRNEQPVISSNALADTIERGEWKPSCQQKQ